MKYVLYNPLSNNKKGEQVVEEVKEKLKGKYCSLQIDCKILTLL